MMESWHMCILTGVKFPPVENPPHGHIIRILVDRTEGGGLWTIRPV